MESDPLPIWSSLVLILALIGMNGLFVAAEYAIARISGERMEAMLQTGGRNAKYVRMIADNAKVYSFACRFGIVTSLLTLAWVGEQAMARTLQSALNPYSIPDGIVHTGAFLLTLVLLATVYLILGDIFPKTFAMRKPEQTALWTALPLVAFYKVTQPAIWLAKAFNEWLSRRSGLETPSGELVHTEEEIRILMKESHKSGYIDNTEWTLVDNIFEFAETSARKIKIPRTDMVCLYADLSYEENREIAVQAMLTRYPVCDPDKDHIIGFVHIKDLLKTEEPAADIRSMVRPMLSVPESIAVSELLRLMQQRRTQMALLLDEYGGTSGLVTIEDIIEEIVGDIRDEFDEERSEIEKVDDNTYLIDGRMLIEEVNSFFGLEIDTENCNTIGGWMYMQIEIPPKPQQQIRFGNYEFSIAEVDRMRISRMTVRRLAQPAAVSESEPLEVRDVS